MRLSSLFATCFIGGVIGAALEQRFGLIIAPIYAVALVALILAARRLSR